MPKASTGKTGNAPIEKQGHTTDSLYGSDPDVRRKVGGKTRELKGK